MRLKAGWMEFILYALGFVLLFEWLRPIEQITSTGNMQYFVIFLALSLLVNYVQLPFWLGFGLKLVYVLYALNALHYKAGLLSSGYYRSLAFDGVYNVKLVLSGEWTDLDDSFRSLLFFILLWLMTYLLRYWVTVRKRIMVFYFMTVLYVTVLDTFTPFDGKRSIVMITAAGFALLGLLFFERILERERLYGKGRLLLKWSAPLAVLIALSMALGFAAPKAAPIWPDPVPFMKSTAEHAKGRLGISKIGYGFDDSKLGGPFIGDNRLVFEAETSSRHYWKVETKDFYTGKGWETSDVPMPVNEFLSNQPFRTENYQDLDSRPSEEAIVKVNLAYSHIPRPYGFESISTDEDVFFRYDASLDKVITFDKQGGAEGKLKEFSINYRRPAFSLKTMRNTDSYYDEAFRSQYTQLPESVPQRVYELAQDITEGENNWFDKAKAVEAHFQRNEFTYDQFNVAMPGEKQDYVDQFLFDTKTGYCDNFSSSMVVLLRALDIPARWAKGYTAGQYRGNSSASGRVYQITNNDAHSWVEVFFPNVGWVPFEPTKGFDSNTLYNYDEESGRNASPYIPKKNEDTTSKKNNKQLKEEDSRSEDRSFSLKDAWVKTKGFILEHAATAVWAGAAVAAAAALLYTLRMKWLPGALIWRYRHLSGDDSFERAYMALLKQLERYGIKRRNGQTLRSYASYIDDFFETKDMGILTSHYEKHLYRAGRPQEDWPRIRELWENLIKRTRG